MRNSDCVIAMWLRVAGLTHLSDRTINDRHTRR